MAMGVGPQGDGEVMMDINTTPLIDVMLVLLTLLIITLPIQTHAVKLDMPRPNQPPPPVPPVIDTLAVQFDGSLTWNNQPVDMATLDSYFVAAAAADPQPEIHLNPDKLAKYDVVARVLADAARLQVKKIGFGNIATYQ